MEPTNGDGPAGDPVRAQYEAFPYPERDPADEARRLITGSPSHPVEIDHFLFGGRRDWRAPFRALVAGGGTGDALVMLAQLLAGRGTPAEIHYLDLSTASRGIAEQRIAARGLSASVTFHTGDLLSAPDLGPFDYIDCCGVLHHLPSPEAGFRALAAALEPTGGMGLMVYAPHGRSGVYALQDAFAALGAELSPHERVGLARETLKDLPETHPFKRNTLLSDHENGDAGLYDLLLHAQDTPFDVARLYAALDEAGLALAGWCEPARYDPSAYLSSEQGRRRAGALDPREQAALAERLAGNLRAHRFYAAPTARGATAARGVAPDATPVVHNLDPRALAQTIAKRGALTLNADGWRRTLKIDPEAARLVAPMDGRTTFDGVAARVGLDWLAAAGRFGALYRMLEGVNHLRLSRFWST